MPTLLQPQPQQLRATPLPPAPSWRSSAKTKKIARLMTILERPMRPAPRPPLARRKKRQAVARRERGDGVAGTAAARASARACAKPFVMTIFILCLCFCFFYTQAGACFVPAFCQKQNAGGAREAKASSGTLQHELWGARAGPVSANRAGTMALRQRPGGRWGRGVQRVVRLVAVAGLRAEGCCRRSVDLATPVVCGSIT